MWGDADVTKYSILIKRGVFEQLEQRTAELWIWFRIV